MFRLCFFFNDTATTEIYTLSLHDALPISGSDLKALRTVARSGGRGYVLKGQKTFITNGQLANLVIVADRKSTRLNSSHANISYAVFCLKKKTNLNNSCLTLHYATNSKARE